MQKTPRHAPLGTKSAITLAVTVATLAIAAMLCGCQAAAPATAPTDGPSASAATPEEEPARESSPAESTEPTKPAAQEASMQIEVNGVTFTATLADTDAARALAEQLATGPITIQASDYSGFEKVGNLGLDPALPASNAQTTTQPGDIVLYNGSQIVLFYGSNSWSYTMLAHVDDLAGWTEALGTGDVTITLSAVTN